MTKSKWFPLAIICLTQIICVCDNSVIFNSLSSLVTSFHCNVTDIQLANSMYPLIAGALMLAGGLLGLKIGWKKLLCIGLLFIGAGELAAGFSPGILFFTWVARVLAGLGASFAIPAAIGLIPANYKGKDLAVGFGALGAAVGIASSFGPIIGGWIIDSYGWRTAFFALAIAFGLVFLLALKVKERNILKTNIKFDYLGTVLFAASMILITLGLINISTWSKVVFITSLATGLIILISFIFYEFNLEKRGKNVILPSIFLKLKIPRAGLVMTSLIFFISGGLSFALVIYLQVVLEFNALRTGFILSINAVGIIIFSIGTPIVIKKVNPCKICRLCIISACASGLIIAFGIKPDSLGILFYSGIFLAGSSVGLLSSQAGLIVMSSIPDKYSALSGGIQGSMRNIGQAFGIALIGLIMISSLTASIKNGVLKNPVTHKLMTPKYKLTKTIPFISDKQLDKYLSKTHLTEIEKTDLIKTNTRSRMKALRISFSAFGLIMLLFYIFTFQIPKSYINKPEK